MELSAEEMRVLGSLVEKEATTPDAYPLSTNALVNACNQKSSRQPVVGYSEATVDSVMMVLRDRGLARTDRGSGSRAFKHRHLIDEALELSPRELALFAVLMLRGAQTTNALWQRTERYCTFESTEAVEGTLADLTVHPQRLAIQLEREAGQREVRWTHRVGGKPSQVGSASQSPMPPMSPPASTPKSVAGDATPPPSAPPVSVVGGDDPASDIAALRTDLEELRRRFDALCESLGESL